jgi:hypothetical protein
MFHWVLETRSQRGTRERTAATSHSATRVAGRARLGRYSRHNLAQPRRQAELCEVMALPQTQKLSVMRPQPTRSHMIKALPTRSLKAASAY